MWVICYGGNATQFNAWRKAFTSTGLNLKLFHLGGEEWNAISAIRAASDALAQSVTTGIGMIASVHVATPIPRDLPGRLRELMLRCDSTSVGGIFLGDKGREEVAPLEWPGMPSTVAQIEGRLAVFRTSNLHRGYTLAIWRMDANVAEKPSDRGDKTETSDE